MTRIFIAAPTTGIPRFDHPAVADAASRLRALGHEVESPVENQDSAGRPPREYVRMVIRQLITCDEVVLLPGWEESRVARIARRIANDLELPARGLQEYLQ